MIGKEKNVTIPWYGSSFRVKAFALPFAQFSFAQSMLVFPVPGLANYHNAPWAYNGVILNRPHSFVWFIEYCKTHKTSSRLACDDTFRNLLPIHSFIYFCFSYNSEVIHSLPFKIKAIRHRSLCLKSDAIWTSEKKSWNSPLRLLLFGISVPLSFFVKFNFSELKLFK